MLRQSPQPPAGVLGRALETHGQEENILPPSDLPTPPTPGLVGGEEQYGRVEGLSAVGAQGREGIFSPK